MKMQHAELIAYAAQHPDGWASLQWARYGIETGVWRSGDAETHPVCQGHLDWRIKPATININVDMPRPVAGPGPGWPLGAIDTVFYRTKELRNEAERILIAALRGGQ